MTLNIGMIGTDSSHTVAFARIINDDQHPFHVAGGKVTKVVRYCSSDFELSYSREERFSSLLSKELHIPFAELSDIGEDCDALLLEAADGRKHLELFTTLLTWKKPIFIDKPLAIGYEAAKEMIQLAERHNVPIMSSSALRYSSVLQEQLRHIDQSQVTKVSVKCPLMIVPTQSRYYWYGIHGVEMLYAILGRGCGTIDVRKEEGLEIISSTWGNGILGEVNLSHDTAQPFEVVIHTAHGETVISLSEEAHQVPYYASLIENIMLFMQQKKSPISNEEMLEVIWFIEQAEQRFEQL
jgi:hypothetical protein